MSDIGLIVVVTKLTGTKLALIERLPIYCMLLQYLQWPKDDRVLGILVLDVGGEHLLLPRHVVCASAVNNPA